MKDPQDIGGKQKRRAHRGGVAVPFPEKLHYMLSRVDGEGVSHIVSWQPHGRCFIVHKPQQFVELVMPRFFKQTKLTSFQRQLNLYGFVRLTAGTDRGGYYHEHFLRGRMDLCRKMARTRVKGNGSKGASSPETEPNFYKMPPASETLSSHAGGPSIVSAEAEENIEDSHNVVPIEVQVPYDSLTSVTGRDDLPELSAVTSSLSMTSLPPLPMVSPVIEGRQMIAPPSPMYLTEFVSTPNVVDEAGAHSGDMLHFEGLPFHYLETKDVEESLILEI